MVSDVKCLWCGSKVKLTGVNEGLSFYACECGAERITGNDITYDNAYFNQFGSFDGYLDSQNNNVKQIMKEVKDGCFLDVGCSNGAMLKAMSEQGFRVYGFDVVNVLKTDLGFEDKVKFYKSLSGWKTSLVFDVVQMREVIEHVPSPVHDLLWVFEHLKEGGWLFIQTPGRNGNFEGKYAPGHVSLVDFTTLESYLLSVGFSVVELISFEEGCLFVKAKK